jgi:predicted RNA-binding protein
MKKVIIDDFKPRGTIFSQGIISTSGRIRPGDIVLVGTENEYRGVGRALVPGGIMNGEVPGPGVQMINRS